MILKQSVLKKMMTAAWKSSFGLTVARIEGWLWIEAEGWEIWMRFSEIPNQIKGDLVTLVGELPADGEGFTAYKDQENQFITSDLTVDDPLQRKINWRDVYKRTFFMLKDDRGMVRVYQNEQKTIKVISSAAEDLICPALLDGDSGELQPEGPAYIKNGLAWSNNFCQAIFYEPAIKAETALMGLATLEEVDIRCYGGGTK